jgi:hypothetical protein
MAVHGPKNLAPMGGLADVERIKPQHQTPIQYKELITADVFLVS